MSQIRHHQRVTALNHLRKALYGVGSNHGRKSRQTAPLIEQKEIDQLMLDALNHAKRMMAIVKELNVALDEFEDQFNMPRFEPNFIDESKDEDF